MHVYFYDPAVESPKYSKLIASIETRITDLGLNGKIIRLGVIKNIGEAARNEIRRGAKTLIVIGGDEIINKVISNLASTDVPLGIIPLVKGSNNIAGSLGIESGLGACDILSARRIEILDLAKINDIHFLSHLSFNLKGTSITIEGKFSVETKKDARGYIVNLATNELQISNYGQIDPQDGLLQLVIKANKNVIFNKSYFDSIFTFKKLKISNQKDSIQLDDGAEISSPANVKIIPRALRVIVGKNRVF